jgi:hypothetical protein
MSFYNVLIKFKLGEKEGHSIIFIPAAASIDLIKIEVYPLALSY